MYKMYIFHNKRNVLEVTLEYHEYQYIMKYLLRSISPDDIFTEVSSASKLAKEDSNNESLSSPNADAP